MEGRMLLLSLMMADMLLRKCSEATKPGKMLSCFARAE